MTIGVQCRRQGIKQQGNPEKCKEKQGQVKEKKRKELKGNCRERNKKVEGDESEYNNYDEKRERKRGGRAKRRHFMR